MYRLTEQAEADIEAIADFIAADSIDAAVKVVLALEDACVLLASRPGTGHAREDLTARPLKFWRVYSYLIVYDDPEDRPVLPGWEVSLSTFFDRRGWHSPPAMYAYDFGDDWQHVLVHEGFEPADDKRSYPRCVAGEGRCPPEDCGGVHGYAEFLQIIADPDHEEHESTLQWAGGHFDPEAFDPAAVKFDDPKKRWKKAFGRRP